MNISQKLAGAAALTFASSMALAATPAAAATSIAAPSVAPVRALDSYFPAPFAGIGEQGADEAAEYGRRFRRRRFRRFRGRRGIRGGDLLAGALILGGIAIVADAINDGNRNRETRTYPRRERNVNVNPVPQQRNNRTTSDINAAADQCAFAAEERYGDGAQVNDINRIERADNGFNVEGTIQVQDQLDSFSCGVIGGEIQYLQFGRGEALLDQ